MDTGFEQAVRVQAKERKEQKEGAEGGAKRGKKHMGYIFAGYPINVRSFLSQTVFSSNNGAIWLSVCSSRYKRSFRMAFHGAACGLTQTTICAMTASALTGTVLVQLGMPTVVLPPIVVVL